MKVIDNENLRIDTYLSNELDISRSKIQKLIKEEKVLVNNKVISNNYKVKLDDEIEIDDNLDFNISVEPKNIKKTSYEDLSFFNKVIISSIVPITTEISAVLKIGKL